MRASFVHLFFFSPLSKSQQFTAGLTEFNSIIQTYCSDPNLSTSSTGNVNILLSCQFFTSRPCTFQLPHSLLVRFSWDQSVCSIMFHAIACVVHSFIYLSLNIPLEELIQFPFQLPSSSLRLAVHASLVQHLRSKKYPKHFSKKLHICNIQKEICRKAS